MSDSHASLVREEGLYRFIHPNNANPDGSLNSGVFSLRRDREISVGIESIIQSRSFERFCELKPTQGVARVGVGEVVDLELSVSLVAEPNWGEFADAHCVLGGYATWPNSKKDSIARHLRDLANKAIRKPVPK